jgi:hypothetical protein
MTQWLREGSTATITIGPAVDQTNGYTPETGLTTASVDEISLWKNDDTTATDIHVNANLQHRSNGFYTLDFTATDTSDCGRLTVYIRDDDVCLPIWKDFMVMTANVFDSLASSTDQLQVDVAEWNNVDVVAPDTAGHPKVTIKDGTGTGEIDLDSGKVLLANGVHGGVDATLTLEKVRVTCKTANEAAVVATGSGSGPGLECVGGTLGSGGHGIETQGNTQGHGIFARGGVTNGAGARFTRQGSNDDIELAGSGSIGGNLSGNVTGSIGSVAADGITSASIQEDAITASHFQTNAISSDAIDATGANKIADHTLRRTWQNARDSSDGDTATGRSLLGAAGKLVNRVVAAGTTLTIYEDDDTTSFFTQTLTTSSTADRITELNTD